MADCVVDMFYLKDPLYMEARREVKIQVNGSGGGQSSFVTAIASRDPMNGNGHSESKIKERVKSLLEAKYGPGFDKAFGDAQPPNSKSNTGFLHPGRYGNLYQQLVKTEKIMMGQPDKKDLTFAEKGDEEGRLPEKEMAVIRSVELDTRTFQNLGQLAGRRRQTKKSKRRARKTRRSRK
jgi:hypothetical protein